MLEAGASAIITATSITHCVASQGGGIYAELSEGAKEASSSAAYNTSIIAIDADLQDNSASNLVVGPFWHISFTNLSLINESSEGVVWGRKLCRKGEYISNTTQFCTPCPAFSFSLLAINDTIGTAPRHAAQRKLQEVLS